MKKRLKFQALSLASAAVMCCSPLLNFSGAGISAAAAEAETVATGELVDVIVRLTDDAILADDEGAAEGADYLSTDAAAKKAKRLASGQAQVLNRIRRYYPALEVQYTYNVLINGFSCTVPKDLVGIIEKLPGVKSVTEVQNYSVPKMTKAEAMRDFPAYYDATGCTGEGMVVAIIDSELDVTNPMFSAIDDKNVALTKDDIAEIADTIGFNVDIDVDKAYVSSKLPFVVDYVDEPYEGVPNPDGYHGTHVAGIAAGNEVDYEGKKISGVAKDAQIVFFANSIITEMGVGISDAGAMAAMEDAIKLHADVINMSFGGMGEVFTSSPFDDMMEEAANAGIIICKAAGNDGYMMNTPDNPETSTLDNIANNAHVLSVASADAPYTQHYKTFTANGEQYLYAEQFDEMLGLEEKFYLGDQLPEKEYRLCDIGDGEEYYIDLLIWYFSQIFGGDDDSYEEEMQSFRSYLKANGYAEQVSAIEKRFGLLEDEDEGEGELLGEGNEDDYGEGEGEEEYVAPDFTDEIIFMDMTMLPADIFADFAAECGAVGEICVIPSNFRNYATAMPFTAYSAAIPMGFVDEPTGIRLHESGAETIVFTDEVVDVDLPTAISPFTSWGVHQNLELRPDIMGYGGNIVSAGYNESLNLMSGTSMATPYLCGCVAILTQYLQQNNYDLSGLDKYTYIRNLLMNTAVPYEVDDVLVTPRRQGAGLVNLSNAIEAKVLMTGSEGLAKVQLYDGLTDTFSFDVTLNNISDETVTFKNAALKFTTDTVETSHDPEDEEGLYDYTYISGGQQALNSEADLSGLTTSVKAGKSKTVTITVQLDKDQIAELSKDFVNGFFIDGFLLLDGANNSSAISIPLLGYYGDWTSIPVITNDPAYTIPSTNIGKNNSFVTSESLAKIYRILLAGASRVTDEERYPEDPDEWFNLSDAAFNHLTDEELEELYSVSEEIGCFSPNGDSLADQLALILGGQRACTFKGIDVIDKDGKVLVEGTEGYAESGGVEGTLYADAGVSDIPDGEYTARVSAYINYEKAKANPETIDVPFIKDTEAPKVKTKLHTVKGRQILTITASDDRLDGIYIMGFGSGFEVGKQNESLALNSLDDFYTITNMTVNVKNDGIGYIPSKSDADALPLIGKFLYGNYRYYSDLGEANFFDVIQAEPDENGRFVLEYDVTDLEYYAVDVMDRAMNISEVKSELPASEELYSGLWMNRERVVSIHSETFNSADLYTGEITKANYTFEDGVLTVTDENGNVRTAKAALEFGSKLILDWDDGEHEVLYYEGGNKLSDFFFYPVNEIEQAVIEHVNMFYAPLYGFEITKTEAFVDDYGDVTVNVWILFQGTEQFLGSYSVYPMEGTGSDAFGDFFSMDMIYPTVPQPFINGMWLAEDETGAQLGYYYFAPEWNWGSFESITDREPSYFNYRCLPEGLLFAFEDWDAIDPDPSRATVEQVNAHTVILTWEDGTKTTLRHMSSETPDTFTFYCTEELKQMAQFDYSVKNEVYPENAEVISTDKGQVTIGLYDENGELLDTYTVDAHTGVGTDSEGEEVNLPQTGNNDITPIAEAAGAILMLIFGAFVMTKSGVLRRKDETI